MHLHQVSRDVTAIEVYNVPVEAVALAELEPVPVAAPEEAAAPGI